MLQGGEKYIDFKQASVRSGYCEEYLRRKARQGVLKAEKRGRLWRTKKEWLDDFMQRKERRKVTLAEKTLFRYDPEKSPAFSVRKEFSKKVFAFSAVILLLVSVFSLFALLHKGPFHFLASILNYLK